MKNNHSKITFKPYTYDQACEEEVKGLGNQMIGFQNDEDINHTSRIKVLTPELLFCM